MAGHIISINNSIVIDGGNNPVLVDVHEGHTELLRPALEELTALETSVQVLLL